MSTGAHIDALVALLVARDWTTATPAQIVAGAVPNALDYPVIAVYAGAGRAVDETLDGVEWQETVEIVIASTQGVDGAADNQGMLIGLKDEIVALLYTTPDFGEPTDVRDSHVTGWDRAVVTFEDESENLLTFDYLTIHVDVRYALDLSGN